MKLNGLETVIGENIEELLKPTQKQDKFRKHCGLQIHTLTLNNQTNM